MKCPQCQTENKDVAKSCRKCGMNLQLPPLWQPTWAWHRKALLTIYAVLIVVFFVVRHFLKPYVRQLPADITSWMHPRAAPSANAVH
jgi:hypothetical protein